MTKREKVDRLFDVCGLRDGSTLIVNHIIDALLNIADMSNMGMTKPQVKKFILQLVQENTPLLTDQYIVPIYEKHLTDEDLDTLIAHHSSPVGQKMRLVNPILASESHVATMAWAESLAGTIQVRLAEDYNIKVDLKEVLQ